MKLGTRLTCLVGSALLAACSSSRPASGSTANTGSAANTGSSQGTGASSRGVTSGSNSGASTASPNGAASSTISVTAASSVSGTGGTSSSGTPGASSATSGGSTAATTGSGSSSSGSLGTDGGPCTGSTTCPTGESCAPSGFCLKAGQCLFTNDCTAGEFCDGGGCQPGGQCGGQELASIVVPPNIIFTVDRSCSMTQVPDGGHASDGGSKWDLAVQAIDDLITTFDGGARFGLTLFPERDAGVGDSCAVTGEAVALGAATSSEIQTVLTDALVKTNSEYPNGPCVTPIDSGVYGSSQDPALSDPSRSSFLILITDGEQTSCHDHGGATGVTTILSTLYQQSPSVGTFVIGFGSEVNSTELSEFAVAGGESFDAGLPDAGGKAYYQVQDLASLQAALQAIASQTVGCVLSLQSTPPDPRQLYVFFQEDGGYVPISNDGGWQYDSSTNEILLLNSACSQAQQGGVTAVDIEYGCPAP